jgi:hypothetical protein
MNPAMNHIRDQRKRKLPSPQGMYILNLLRITDHPYLEEYPVNVGVKLAMCSTRSDSFGKKLLLFPPTRPLQPPDWKLRRQK